MAEHRRPRKNDGLRHLLSLRVMKGEIAMSENHATATTRRDFLSNAGRGAAASALAGVALPHVHAAENNTIQLALVGCGGRGTGAAINALSVQNSPTRLVA